jgi:catalase
VKDHNKKSPALSMDKVAQEIKGRRIAVLAGEGVDGGHLAEIRKTLADAETVVEVIAAKAGTFKCSKGNDVRVNRAAPNAPSVFYDAVIVPGGKSAVALAQSGAAINFVQEAFHHGKPIAALGDGGKLLEAAHLPNVGEEQGVFRGDAADILGRFADGLKKHRFRNRDIAVVPA